MLFVLALVVNSLNDFFRKNLFDCFYKKPVVWENMDFIHIQVSTLQRGEGENAYPVGHGLDNVRGVWKDYHGFFRKKVCRRLKFGRW